MQVDFRRVVQRLLRRALRPPHPPRLVVAPVPIQLFIPSSHHAAAARLQDFDAVRSMRLKTTRERVSFDGVDPDFRRFAVAFLRDLDRRGYPFFAHSYVRGRAEQDELFRKGVSRAKFGQSAHNFGCAGDFVHFTRAWDLTRKEWAVLGLIGKDVARRCNLKIVWGGDWSFYDPAHWELADWKKRQ